MVENIFFTLPVKKTLNCDKESSNNDTTTHFETLYTGYLMITLMPSTTELPLSEQMRTNNNKLKSTQKSEFDNIIIYVIP